MSKDKLRSSQTSSMGDHNETDNVSTIQLQRHRRVLYFSDGTIEEPSDSDIDLDQADIGLEATIGDVCGYRIKNSEHNIRSTTLSYKHLPLLHRFRCKINRAGANILTGIDYVGGEVASLLGISRPEASERELYPRTGKREEPPWTNKSSGNTLMEVVTRKPKRVQNND